MKPNQTKFLSAALAIGLLALCTIESNAAIRAKANNADNLNLASSWTNNLPPGTADVAQFDGTITTPITVALGANLSWNQINFASPGGDVTIAAGNTLTLSNNNPIAFSAGTVSLTLNCDVNFAGTGFSLVSAPSGAGQMLTLGGVVQGRNATVTL